MIIIKVKLFCFSGALALSSIMSFTYSLIDVMGVFKSCEMWGMSSFLMFSYCKLGWDDFFNSYLISPTAA